MYCGLSHDRPDQVRECWQLSQAGATSAPPKSATLPLTERVARPLDPSAPSARRSSGPPLPEDLVRWAGPEEFGRGLVVLGDAPAAAPWMDADRIVVDATSLVAPAETVARLRRSAHQRERVVVELRIPFADPPLQRDDRALHEIGPRGELLLDELHHLVWTNNVDGTGSGAPWPLAQRAVALGATSAGAADVALPDGTAAWLDGGPLQFRTDVGGTAIVHRTAIEHRSLRPFLSNVSAADLAPDQLAAVTAVGGAARIIAPAGSGKTRVLTERARHLVGSWLLPPAAITMVAYNRRAQIEMESRLDDVPGVQVRTLNSIALAIVNGTRPFARRPARVQTLNELDVRRILGDMVQSPRRRNVDPLAPWLEAMSTVRLGLRRASEVEDLYDGDVSGLAQVLPLYEAELARRSALDFDGQITAAISLLLTDADVRAAAQRACRVLLVDEFQDLTPAHVLLVRLLGAPGGSVYGVGDDDQTIYGYNGADPSWLIDYASLFPAAEDHPLEVNYRCPADVVERVERMLRRNTRRVPKVIRAAKVAETGMEIVPTDDPVAATVAAVQAAVASGRAKSDVAVLARVNAVLVPVQVALGVAGIGCARVAGSEFLNRTPVRAALAWLRLATAPDSRLDPSDLAEAIRRPSRSLSPRVAAWVAEQRSMAALHRLAARIDGKDSTAVDAFVADLVLARSTAATGTTDDLLSDVFDDLGLAGTLASFDLNRRGTNTSAQSDDLLALRHLAALQPDPGAFAEWLRDELERPPDPSGVTLATVHRVKGQEWPFVVVHLADVDQFPHRLADDGEEERRLFHVALTRTSGTVRAICTHRPSPFIRELTEEPSERDVAVRAPAAVTRAAALRPSSSTPGRDVFVAGSVIAGPGLVIVDQGQEWSVESVDDAGATAVAGGASRLFPFGRKVATGGKQRGELAAAPAGTAPASAAVFDLLRVLRDRVRSGKPAYTVFDDATLERIALSLPTTIPDLAKVKGIGPAKLELYGDAVIDVVNSAG